MVIKVYYIFYLNFIKKIIYVLAFHNRYEKNMKRETIVTNDEKS